MRAFLLSAAAIAALSVAMPARAAFTAVDISSYVNSNVALGTTTFPIGRTTGNRGTRIPFRTSSFGPDPKALGFYSSTAPLSVDLTGLKISGQVSFYALLNNTFGTPGIDEYDITIKATNGDAVTYQSIGGVDTRDYNQNIFTNAIASTTTVWYDNIALTGNPSSYQRLDAREFRLPISFAGETIASFDITPRQTNDVVLFAGLTFSDQPPAVFTTPEPASLALMTIGLLGLRRARR